MLRRPSLEQLAPWLVTLSLFGLWEAASYGFAIPIYVLPPPSLVFQEMWVFREAIWTNSLVTLWTTLVGFAMAVVFGLVLGIVIGWSRAIYAGLYPVVVGFNAIPKVAVVPILRHE